MADLSLDLFVKEAEFRARPPLADWITVAHAVHVIEFEKEGESMAVIIDYEKAPEEMTLRQVFKGLAIEPNEYDVTTENDDGDVPVDLDKLADDYNYIHLEPRAEDDETIYMSMGGKSARRPKPKPKSKPKSKPKPKPKSKPKSAHRSKSKPKPKSAHRSKSKSKPKSARHQ